MGRFSITVQVKTKADGTEFIDLFRDLIIKKGYAECFEDEAELTYFLAFGGGGWATLASERYTDGISGYDDAIKLAEELKTAAVVVEVVDSDFATLKLHLPDDSKNIVLIGDASGYGIANPPNPKRSFWETLLTEGETWEHFCDIATKRNVFVEDTLGALAPVLGIAPNLICEDHRDFLENEYDGITALYFKK